MMQNQIKLPDKNHLLESAGLTARLAGSMAEIVDRIEMRSEAAGVDVSSSISTETTTSGSIRIEAIVDSEEVAVELIDEFLDEEAVS